MAKVTTSNTTAIKWKGTRKGRISAKGIQEVNGTEVEWLVAKSLGGLHYELHLFEIKATPVVTRATLAECRTYAENYFR